MSLGGLAWLVVAQHDQLGRAIAGIGHARARLLVAAIVCERVSMFSLARMQRRLLLVWSAGSAAGSIGLTPGGVGIVEVALVAALTGTGAPAAGATVAVMIYRLISFWLVLLVGWVFFTVIRFRRPRRAAVTVESGSTPEPGLADSE